VDLPAGGVADLGALTLRAGGHLVARLQWPTSVVDRDRTRTRVTARGIEKGASLMLELRGDAWVSPAIPPGRYVVSVACLGAAVLPTEADVEPGSETEVQLALVPAVTQLLQFFAAPPERDTPISISVRTASGAVAWEIRDGTVPAVDGPLTSEGVPLLTMGAPLIPGTYVVDGSYAGHTLAATTHTTDAATPWDFELP
jgi:hypothetical protein